MAQELKAYNVVATADVNPEVVDSLGCTEWAGYDKDEVDAVLAEKDAEIAELKAKNAQIEDDVAFWKTKVEKYKRCLAMSECREAQALWCYQAANTLPPGVTATLNGKPVMVEPRQLFIRSERLLLASGLWKRRSEKFKEAK
jgi:hypothetical protein